MDIRRILVPTDYSSTSKPALVYAIDLALKVCARVDLVHAWDMPEPTHRQAVAGAPPMPLFVLARDREIRNMDVFLASISHPHVELRGHVELGAIADVIVEVAGRGYDLVVMSTHGRAGIERLWKRSVAERVVRSAPCPVLTIGADAVVATALSNREGAHGPA